MHSDELIDAVRAAGQIPSADPTFDDARVLLELTDMQQQLFERLLVNTREGHLLQQHTESTVSGTSVYRLPHRAITQGAEHVELAVSGGRYAQLTKLSPKDASYWEGSSGQPRAFTLRGDSMQLFPTPDGAYTLRVHYYLRPGQIVATQLGASSAGLVTAVNTTVSAITMDAYPDNMAVDPPVEVALGDRIDVVRANGAHDLVLVGALITAKSLGTFAVVGSDMSRVAVGDYVRYAGQSEWPQLPPEFHRSLADATAAAILLAKGATQKAQSIGAKVATDLQRYNDLLNPRVKDQPRVIKPRYGVLRRSAFPWRR